MGDSIFVVTLISGQDLLCKMELADDGERKRLKDIRAIAVSQAGVSLVPYPMWTKETVMDIREEHILNIGEPDAELESKYREAISGLITPPANNLSVVGG